MKRQFLIVFLLGTFFMFSQEQSTFSIDWKQEYESSSKSNIWTGTNIFHQNNFVPTYIKQWSKDVSGNLTAVNFTNVVTNNIATNTLSKETLNALPNSFNPVLRIVKERNQEYFSVQANAMYKTNNGNVVQVQSFSVSYNITNNTTNNRTNTRILNTNVVTNSVLSTGTWYKIAVDKTGVFKMDANFLSSIGIDVSSLNPQQIRVYGNGGAMLPELLSDERKEDLTENAIYVSGENDGVFNNDDYVLFYAQGPVSWNLESRSKISHIQNIYSDYAYYFINVDSGVNGKRINSSNGFSGAATINISTFTDYKVHEKDLFNYIRAGRKWFGENFSVNNQQSFNFNFPNLVTNQNVIISGSFSAKSSSVASSYSVIYNNEEVLGTNLYYTDLGFLDTKISNTFLSEGDDINLNVIWNNNGDLSALGYLDYLEVVADRNLIATGNQFGFTNFNSKLTGEVLQYVIGNDQNLDFVWNVTEHTNPVMMVDTDNSSNNFVFKEQSDGNLKKYQVVNISDSYTPIKLSSTANVENQNLHALENIQYVILTTKELMSEANRVAEYHRNNTTISTTNPTNINVEVVDVEKVYNEFGSGSPDITAIRDFAKFLYDKGTSDDTKLKYLCLFGDASFDFKGITYENNTQLIPAYQSTRSNSLVTSYNTDDYYAYLDEFDDVINDGELDSSGKLDIVTGRIPVPTAAKAKQFVDKLLNYFSTKTRGNWKNKITLLGDDGQDGSDQGLIKYLEESSLIIEENNPDFNISKLYSDAFKEEVTSGGGIYPEITKKFHDAFNNGSLVINYFGHGNYYNLAQEVFLDIPTIKSLRNINNLPLFITVTCDFSRFDDPTILSGGEELIENPFGGAIAMVATSREISIFSGNGINKNLANYLYNFDDKVRTAAESLTDTKNNVSYSNEFFVYFLGDPAMKLARPQNDISITKIEKYFTNVDNGEEISLEEITELNALSKVKVSGNVNEEGNVLSDFNGTLYVTLFDKEIERKTLLNEGSGNVVNFNSLESKVFVGEASVTNGKFSFDFVLSKDVSISPEDAKFSFYATSTTDERAGSDFNYKIGGVDPNSPEDNTPPVIQLFMDDETFTDGGNTTTTPTLLAKLNDENGINTSLNSIGHNITLIVDGDLSNPITLNEYYTTEKDDFTSGLVSFDMPELSPGNHTITFKAWDTHNNSSTETLNFYAQEDKGFKLSRVLNYPNPFINHTEFWFKNNRQGEPLEITVQIYTMSGKLVKTLHASDSNIDEISRTVTWDGKDDFGNKLGKGVYIYKLKVKEIISGQSDEKIEKLVIL